MGNWGNYNLPAIWSMIEQENQCTGADRVLDWQNLAQGVREQHRRLKKSGEDLAAAWSPDTNQSAGNFFRYLDHLASSMSDTLTRAENTRLGLQGVIEAISTAQMTIRPLVSERADAADDIVPRMVDHAEDEYDEKAQRAMEQAERTISEHLNQIESPAMFTMSGGGVERGDPLQGDPPPGGGGPGSGGGSGSGSGSGSGPVLHATPIPVTVPNDPPDIQPLPEGGPADGGSGNPGTIPGSTIPPGSGSGPDLAGVITPGSAPIGVGNPGPLPPATPLGGGGGGGGVPGLMTGALGLAPGLGGGAGLPMSGLGVGRSGAAMGRQPVPMRQGLPSGAVIGGQPGGRGGPGQMMTGQSGRGAGGESEEEILPGGEADQLWGVDSGVTPVIRPDTTEARHDPGPGVIGRRP
ncbi:hypothetical protein AB0M54_21835 [Actinoplanes sp. NPDC051470]|uniref:hypothetical protein n=1 Tax=Actinoplanes sp. NPDC051470 TaxID=3157224 RepID=UPI003418436F